MSASTDDIRQLYDAMPYPKPLKDLKPFLQGKSCMPASPRQFYHLLWPRRPYRTGLKILVAGCGTSQAAILAALNPESHVTGIDVCERSLAYTGALAKEHGLQNLTLEHLPVEEVKALETQYDFIMCSGVLHHLPDPDKGLMALRDVLDEDGVLAVMVYARYGRSGLYMIQDYCRRLQIQVNDQELQDLRQLLQTLSSEHPLLQFAKYYRRALQYDGEVADMFLNPLDRPYTVPEIYAWAERCGLSLRQWCPQALYVPRCSPLAGTPHLERILALPEPEQHAVMELYWGTISKHQFLLCRDDVPPESYRIDFDTDAWKQYVPLQRIGLAVKRDQLPEGVNMQVAINEEELQIRPISLNVLQAHVLVKTAEGKNQKTVSEIMEATPLQGQPDDVEFAFRELFRSLWDVDVIYFKDLA